MLHPTLLSSVRSILTTGITVIFKKTLYLIQQNHFHYNPPLAPSVENTTYRRYNQKKTSSRWTHLTSWWRNKAVSRLLSVQVIRKCHVTTRTTTETDSVAGVYWSNSFRSVMHWLAVSTHCKVSNTTTVHFLILNIGAIVTLVSISDILRSTTSGKKGKQ